MKGTFDRLRLPPRKKFHLEDAGASDTSEWPGGKRKAGIALDALRDELDRLQELFYADARRSLLVVLQGMDTSGKDGVIRHVFEGVNPQGVNVTSFKPPSREEAAQDFLWRIHLKTPPKGEIAIFNRSHYEDVLAARVHALVPRRIWSKRFAIINAFEKGLVDEGTTILKFFLHISRDEQRSRLRERIDDPSKHWKLSAADLKERRFWAQYRSAYEEMLRKTSTPWAPWYILPSDQKWYRNLAVSSILVDALNGMKLRLPEPSVDVSSLKLD